MLYIRRLPSTIYNYSNIVIIFLISFLVILYLLFHWGIVCSNIQPWHHVNSLCKQYKNKAVLGDICSPLCDSENISSLSCETFHAGKETVFSAVKDGNTKLMIKLAHQVEQPSLLHWVDQGTLRYPSEDEFIEMIIDHVSTRLNTSINREQAVLLAGRLTPQDRHQEMQERWNLLQDNEYLLAVLFAHHQVFPHLLGSCGKYFALEYLNPAIQRHALSTEESSWVIRVNTAILILDLLLRLDKISNGLSLCDVKPSHFGLSSSRDRVKFIDLDVVLPRAIVNKVTADGSKCQDDADCSFFDCRSHCNKQTHQCDSPQTNTNLQIVCEKIFLGWTVSSGGILPGLLLAPQTPTSLIQILHQCSKSGSIFPVSAVNLKERLLAVLRDSENAAG